MGRALGTRRRGSENRENDQTFLTTVTDAVHYAGGSEGAASAGDELFFAADLNLGFAFEDDVKLILSRVGVRGVLLSGFKTIESGEERVAASDIGLRHFLGRELGESGEALYDHLGACGYA